MVEKRGGQQGQLGDKVTNIKRDNKYKRQFKSDIPKDRDRRNRKEFDQRARNKLILNPDLYIKKAGHSCNQQKLNQSRTKRTKI